MVMPTGISKRTLKNHPGLEEALIEHGIDPHSKQKLEPGSKDYKIYEALRTRAKGIEHRTYGKWKAHARADGLDVVNSETEYQRFKQQCFDDLERDKDGNYMCPICSGENAHPLMVQPYIESIKSRNDKGHTISINKDSNMLVSNNIHAWTPSVDKIHDHLLHTINNVQVICWKMNKHKGNLSLSELQDLGHWAENREIDESAGYYD